MNKSTIIISALFLVASFGFAQEQTVPTIRILPEDVVQTSIQQVRFGTNSFAVRWTYTEAGARKMLAFRESHNGQKVDTEVGSYEFTGMIDAFGVPPGCASYSEWREGWLKHRTDKFFGVSETDAHEILVGLKSK